MPGPAPSSSLAAAAAREALHRFPVWFGAWLSIGHVYTALWLMHPSRPSAMATVMLPLAWTVAYYACLPRGARPSAQVLAALAVSAPLVAALWWLPARVMYDPADAATLRFAFELLAPLWALALAAHCWRDRRWRGIAVFFGLGTVYGLVLETSGINLGYFVEAGYRTYVPFTNTPLSSVAGWCTIFYPTVYTAEVVAARLRPSSWVLVPALVVTVDALSADLHFDPIATALGMWVWDPQLPPVWLGVPAVNFASWVSALLPAALVYFAVATRLRQRRAVAAAAVLGVPVALLLAAAMNLLLMGLIEGVDGPSWRIFLEFVRGFTG